MSGAWALRKQSSFVHWYASLSLPSPKHCTSEKEEPAGTLTSYAPTSAFAPRLGPQHTSATRAHCIFDGLLSSRVLFVGSA